MKLFVPVAALIGACMPSAWAQSNSEMTLTEKAYVAGYKAAFTCSALFNANQTLNEIEANELTGIYPDYRATLRDMEAISINESAKTVSVPYHPSHPPRIAAWRNGFGCTQLPIGANMGAVAYLPRFEEAFPAPRETDRGSAIGAEVNLTLPVHLTDALQAPITFAFDGQTYGDGTQTSAALVVRRGEVIAEQYARGIDAETPQRTWSVAKSITATVLGVAAGDSVLDRQSTGLLEAWRLGSDPRRNISLAQLLQMASGLESGARGSRTDSVYFGGGRVIDEAVTASLEVQPGMRFTYANNDTLAAMRSLREALGDDDVYHNYPYAQLLWKIGAFNTVLEADWNGDFVSSSQVWSTARDLARLGQLYLNNGWWGDEQLFHPEWREFVMTPAPAQPDNNGFAYGAGFWLMSSFDGVPSDAFAAMGHRGQYIVIIPSKDLVIVRRGYDYSGGTRFDIAGFTRDVVGAIDAAEATREAADAAARAAYQEAVQELTPEERRLRRDRPRTLATRPLPDLSPKDE